METIGQVTNVDKLSFFENNPETKTYSKNTDGVQKKMV